MTNSKRGTSPERLE
ncbi:unnamed protein product, partial [Rotaria sp. Silwood2]